MIHKCKFCGKEFDGNNFKNGNARRYCSDECRKQEDQRRHRERSKLKTLERRKGIQSRKCEVCGKTYMPLTSDGKYNRKARWCSHECRKISYRKYPNYIKKPEKEEEQRKKVRCLPLGEVLRLAREANMSYGQYVAQNLS